MKLRLKPVGQQTIVITGAASGIGRATALMAARRGASVIAAARDETALRQLVQEIEAVGGRAVYVLADPADAAQLDRVAESAVARFGGFDTWVNDAGVDAHGRPDEIQLDERRGLFDGMFWGVVNGSRSALPQLRKGGGALINLGGLESDVARPLTGIHAAARHAVKAYTDTLRAELEAEHVPVSVTFVRPAASSAPATSLAHDPEMVAQAILHCAEHPTPDVVVSGAGGMLSTMHGDSIPHSPQLALGSEAPAGERDVLLTASSDTGTVRLRRVRQVVRSSLHTAAGVRPLIRTALVAGVGVAVAAGVRRLSGRGS